MIVISSTELRNDTEKYLDIAKTQKVVIQRNCLSRAPYK